VLPQISIIETTTISGGKGRNSLSPCFNKKHFRISTWVCGARVMVGICHLTMTQKRQLRPIRLQPSPRCLSKQSKAATILL